MTDSSVINIVRSIVLFVVAGLFEIGGGWLMWKWLREHWAVGWGLLGAVIIVLYGIIPTLQQAHFGRVYAVYGGFFIVLSSVGDGHLTEIDLITGTSPAHASRW